MRQGEIKEAVVVVRVHESGDKFLCAYIVSNQGVVLSAAELREYLSRELPDYMVPSYFLFLDEIPLNPNGKVDWKALESIGFGIGSGTEFVPPGNEMEKLIAAAGKGYLKLTVREQMIIFLK